MARSGSECLTDTPALEKPSAKASSESPRVADSERKHRNGVPIKRNQRLHLELPLVVYSLPPGRKPQLLVGAARSAVVYAGGGVLTPGANVEVGQELLLVNPQNRAQAACRVVSFEPQKNGCPSMVRVEFTRPVAKFWGVVFPPENPDPGERKRPRPPRRSRRVESSQPIQVRQPEEAVSDACITQNISREGLYFRSDQLNYREGMRLTISFLRHSDLFAPNAGYAAQIVRVDGVTDGKIGVAVKLLGNNQVRPGAAPAPTRSDVVMKGIANSLASVLRDIDTSVRNTGIQIVRGSVAYFDRTRRLAGEQTQALVRLCGTVAKLCKTTAREWCKTAAGLVRSCCSAALAAALSIGLQFMKISSEISGYLQKFVCAMAVSLERAKSFELWSSLLQRHTAHYPAEPKVR
jgi:hypothetical protein